MQDWVYRKSGLYEYHFKELREKRWKDFQRTMDYMGTAPGIGEPFDAISGVMSAIDGDWTGVALSTAALMPIGGQVATAIKIQRHHIIPKAVYKKSSKAIQEAFDLNGGFNLKKIPAPFHGNHPQYSIFVTNQLNNLKEISPASIKNLQKELSSMINQAYDNYKSTGQNLNEYFRQLNAN